MSEHDPNVFIQWKGTDICADVHCGCGESFHLCGEMFVYAIQCPYCDAVWHWAQETFPLLPGTTKYGHEPVRGEKDIEWGQ